MKHFKLATALLGLAFIGVGVAPTFLHAEEPTTKPVVKSKPKARLVQPWSKLTGLTDKQVEEIMALHAKSIEEVKAIQAKEHADILALLTEQQRAELDKLDATTKAEQKARALEQKEKAKEEPKEPAGQ